MYYAICYVSNENDLLNFEIKELLASSSKSNQENGISGILLHNSGNFIQYMEGEESAVKKLYHEKIVRDTRHKNLILLMEKKIETLLFDGYETGFTAILEEKEKKEKLRSYLNMLKHLASNEVDAVTNTIETFLGKSSNK